MGVTVVTLMISDALKILDKYLVVDSEPKLRFKENRRDICDVDISEYWAKCGDG